MNTAMKPLVLLVEDEEALLTMLRYNLERDGFEVATALNGEEALIAVDERRPDLMLLDWMLPLVSGIEDSRRPRIMRSVVCTAREASLPVASITIESPFEISSPRIAVTLFALARTSRFTTLTLAEKDFAAWAICAAGRA